MKRILLTLIFSSFLIVPAYSLGLNVGISGNMGIFHATGEESENGDKSTEDATGVAGYSSVFIEAAIGERFAIGIDMVPGTLSSETANNDRNDKDEQADEAFSAVTNKVKVDFTNLNTLYATLRLTDTLYLKAGAVSVDVETKESLGTGSTYTDTDMSGETYGIGYNNTFDNGFFYRVEGTYLDFGSASVTASNTDNKVSLKNLEGASARISIGKSF